MSSKWTYSRHSHPDMKLEDRIDAITSIGPSANRFSLVGGDLHSNRHSMLLGAGDAELRSNLKALLDDARSDRKSFLRDSMVNGLAFGVCASKYEDRQKAPTIMRLLKALIKILRDSTDVGSCFGDSLELLMILCSCDPGLKLVILERDVGLIDHVASKLRPFRDTPDTIRALTLLQMIMRDASVQATPNVVALAEDLRHHCMTVSSPNPVALGSLASLCTNPDICGHINSSRDVDRFYRGIIRLLSETDFHFLLAVYALQLLVRLTLHNSIGQKFFNDTNVNESWKLIWSLLSKAEATASTAPVIVLLDMMAGHLDLRKSLSSFTKDKSIISKATAQLSTLEEPLMLYYFLSVLMKHSVNDLAVSSEIHSIRAVSHAASFIESQTKGFVGCELHYAVAFIRGVCRKIADGVKEYRALSAHLSEVIPKVLGVIRHCLADGEDSISSTCSAIPALLEIFELLDDVLHSVQVSSKVENVDRSSLKIFLQLFCMEPAVNSHPPGTIDLAVLAAKLYVDLTLCNDSNCSAVTMFHQNPTFVNFLQKALRHTIYPSVCKAAVGILSSSELGGLSALISRTNISFGASVLSSFITEGRAIGICKRPDLSILDSSSNQRLDFEYSQTVTQLQDADKSILAISDLEREVENIAERIRRENELKSAMAERKLAAYEVKNALQNTEISQLKEILDQKILLIRQLEQTQNDLNLRVTELTSAVVNFEKEQSWFKEEAERTSQELKDRRRKEAALESSLQIQGKELKQMKEALDSTRIDLTVATHRADALEAELTSVNDNFQRTVRNMEIKLETAREEETRWKNETTIMKERCGEKDIQVSALEKRVRELEEEEKAHDDVVAKLAQSLEGLTTRRKKTLS